MLRGKRPQGFTIVEVMIFLTVSGILFISAVALIGGQQDKTEFFDAIHDTFSQLQALSDNVQVGQFTTPSNFTCTADSAGDAPLITSGGTTIEGGHLGCILIGQFIQFSPGGNKNQYAIYTVIGRQYQGATGSQPVTSINMAKPTVLTSNVQTVTLPEGLTVGSISYTDPSQAGKQYTSLVGFMSSFAPLQASSPILQSGSQTVDLVPLPVIGNNSNFFTLYLYITPSATVNDINGMSVNSSNQVFTGSVPTANTVLNPQGGVSVCFTSATTNEVGIVNIGTNDNPTGMQLTISNGSCS